MRGALAIAIGVFALMAGINLEAVDTPTTLLTHGYDSDLSTSAPTTAMEESGRPAEGGLSASLAVVGHGYDDPLHFANTNALPAFGFFAPESLLNRAGRSYPEVIDLRTGSAIPHPGAGLQKVPVAERVPWGSQERGSFIKQWYDRGFGTPEGGWSNYDIHHIQPREYGGTNVFENLAPVPRTVHQQEFNAWWRDY